LHFASNAVSLWY